MPRALDIIRCRHCGVDLTEAPEQGSCPECRHPYVAWKEKEIQERARLDRELKGRRRLRRESPMGPPRCPACGYNLGGLAAAGTCPECSADYDASTVVRKPLWPDPPSMKSQLWIAAVGLNPLWFMCVFQTNQFVFPLTVMSVGCVTWLMRSCVDLNRVIQGRPYWGKAGSGWEHPLWLVVTRGAAAVCLPLLCVAGYLIVTESLKRFARGGVPFF